METSAEKMIGEAQLPGNMQAVLFEGEGGPEVIRLTDRPIPGVGPGQVLIAVAAAGINRPDVMQRKGLYPPPPGAPDIPGLEVAGRVAAIGDGVDLWQVGDRVCALVNGGGYAGYCLADARHCLPLGDGMSDVEGAAIPETLFTVWSNLFERAHVRDGEMVLVHGGTSGIGTMAISLCKALGVRIVVTCGREEKCEKARELGADLAINYRARDFVGDVKAFTGGRGVDAVLDMISGDYVARNLDCLAEDGRHVTIAVQGGVKATIPMVKLLTRRLTLTGSTLRPRSADFKAAVADEIRQHVWSLVESGEIRPVIDSTFPLAQASLAHQRMDEGGHVGKIVLEI